MPSWTSEQLSYHDGNRFRDRGFIGVLTTCKKLYLELSFFRVGRGSCREGCRQLHSYEILIRVYSRIPPSMVKITTIIIYTSKKKKEDWRFENYLDEGIGIEYSLSDRLTTCCTVAAMIN